MTVIPSEPTSSLPELPHWESTPADPKAAVREVKAALRSRLKAAGRPVDQVFAVIEKSVAAKVAHRSKRRKAMASRSGR